MHREIIGSGGFIADEASGIPAVLGHSGFDGVQRRNHFIRPPRHHDLHRMSEPESTPAILNAYGVRYGVGPVARISAHFDRIIAFFQVGKSHSAR